MFYAPAFGSGAGGCQQQPADDRAERCHARTVSVSARRMAGVSGTCG